MGSIPITQKAKSKLEDIISSSKYNANLVAGEAQTFDRFQDASNSIAGRVGGGAPIPPVVEEGNKDITEGDTQKSSDTGASTKVSLTDPKPNYFKASGDLSNFKTDSELKSLSSNIKTFNKKYF